MPASADIAEARLLLERAEREPDPEQETRHIEEALLLLESLDDPTPEETTLVANLQPFVAAVFAGLASYPLAAAGAIGVGVIEAFGSFWASAFKEVIVFTTILPILLWRSLRDPHHDDE